MSGGGKGGSQTVTTKLDADAAKFREGLYKKSNQIGRQEYSGYGGPGVAAVNPMTMQALGELGPNGALAQGYGQAAGGLGIGMDAMQRGLGMNFANADMSAYMNPYQQQVIDQYNRQFGDMRQATMGNINDQATQARAFGGSRQGVATGQALADLGKTQAMQTAQLYQQGFGDAANRWEADRQMQMQGGQAMTNLGMAGLYGQQGLTDARLRGGDYLRNAQQQQYDYNRGQFMEQRDWPLRQQQALLAAMGAPVGQTQSTPYSSNPLGGAMGGAMAGSAFGAPGAIVGGGLGLIGSFFG